MNSEKSQEILKAFGNPVIKTEKANLVFARQSSKDIEQIQQMTDEQLIKHWKSLIWMNYIYGQVSLNDLQRISLIELEFNDRSSINWDELNKWYKEQEDNFDEDQFYY